MDCILNNSSTGMRFLDYSNKVELTTTNQTFNKDGVISIRAGGSYAYLYIDDVMVGWYHQVYSGVSPLFPIKAGSKVRVDNPTDTTIFIPFLD